jgi:hypothetical protein
MDDALVAGGETPEEWQMEGGATISVHEVAAQ